uniref:Uncharacterized protein n=1 Tax=Arundo donax TaxID=35708 RepID=A0A0A8Z979_ARUDO
MSSVRAAPRCRSTPSVRASPRCRLTQKLQRGREHDEGLKDLTFELFVWRHSSFWIPCSNG